MKLVGAWLEGFRCYEHRTAFLFDALTVLIGRNDAGKSSVLDALAIFFDEKDAPDGDDVCVHCGTKEVRIACLFADLPTKLVLDATHPTDLQAEHLLNGEGRLEIVKTYSCGSTGKGKLKTVHASAYHPTAEGYGDLLTLKISELKARAQQLGVPLGAVNQTISTKLRRAIWNHAADLAPAIVPIDLMKAEQAKVVWEQLREHMPVFALFKSDRPSTDQDAEAQDPLKAAIQIAVDQEKEALEKITAQVKEEIQAVADRTVEKIAEIAPDLASQLSPRVSVKKWESLFGVSLTGDEAIPINKRGSGTRRIVLLSFFRAEAERQAQGREACTIYAVEEPETSQHPLNQKLLIDAFSSLAEAPGCQILITTHTPVLARRFPEAALRYLEQADGQVSVQRGGDPGVTEAIVDSLGVLPDHNIRVFVGVEGRHDMVHLTTLSRILNEAGETDVPNLELAEKSGQLLFVPLGGSCLDLWVSRLSGLNRPEFYLFDRDNSPGRPGKNDAWATEVEARPGTVVWTTEYRELENYIHREAIRSVIPAYAGTGDGAEDVPELAARAVHEASETTVPWDDVRADADKLAKKVSRAKAQLNRECVAQMTPERLTAVDPAGGLRAWLRQIGQALETE